MDDHSQASDREDSKKDRFRNEVVGIEERVETAHFRGEFSGGESSSSSLYIPPLAWPVSRQTTSLYHHPSGGHQGHPYQANDTHFYPHGTNQFAPVLSPQLPFEYRSYLGRAIGGHSPYHNQFPRRGIGPPLSSTHPNATLRQDLYPPPPPPPPPMPTTYLDPLFLPAFHPPPHGLAPPIGREMPIPTQQEPMIARTSNSNPLELDPTGLGAVLNTGFPNEEVSEAGLVEGGGGGGGGDAGVSSNASMTIREGVSSESEEERERNSNPDSLTVVSSDSEQPEVGTTPIFHPLPSMFSSVPRPLSFPLANGGKELPTLALFSKCNLESKVVTDYADSQQELSLMLALPGLSTRQAPLLSLQQAGDILQAINNPLVVLKVGRLTRKLVPNPALLRPTDDVGTLALWLSPTSDVRLFWHSFLKGPSADSVREIEEQITQLRYAGEGSPYRELFSHVELTEELAWVAAESDQMDGGTGIRLEMIDHDPSGRSFKLTRKKSHDRHKMELASKLASEEDQQAEDQKQKSGEDQISDENQKLKQLLATCMSEDSEEEETFFFWIAETSLSEGMEMLNDIQNRLDHLPTLAGVSGVPEKKLQELFDWFSKAQEAASHSTDSTLSHELSSWVDLKSGASVPSQLFSNTCPAIVPNWSSSSSPEEASSSTNDQQQQQQQQQLEGDHPVENTIREGCALSATANFLVADKKWGLTHLATASVMVAVGVESTGFFYDEEKAHKDASHCAHELAKKRAEAGASAEAERLGRIRLEELVAVKSHKEMKSNTKSRSSTSTTLNESVRSMEGTPCSSSSSSSTQPLPQEQNSQSTGVNNEGPHVSSTTNRQPTRGNRSGTSGNTIKHQIFSVQKHYVNLEPVVSTPNVPGSCLQGNSYLHNSPVHEYPNMGTHMPEYLRQHVHYGVPVDQGVYHSWRYYHGEAGPTQVMGQAPHQYEHPYWNVHRINSYPPPVHSVPEASQWSFNHQPSAPVPVPRALFQPQYEALTRPAFYPRHLPPHLPFMQMSQLHGARRPNPPNMSLVRIAQEAREKVTRVPRDRVRPAPSGSNLAASNVHLYQDQCAESYAWHNQAHQLNSLYSNQLNVACKQETTENNSQEPRACAETPKRATADDGDFV